MKGKPRMCIACEVRENQLSAAPRCGNGSGAQNQDRESEPEAEEGPKILQRPDQLETQSIWIKNETRRAR